MRFAKRVLGGGVVVAAALALSAGTASAHEHNVINNGNVNAPDSLVHAPINLNVEDVAVAVAGGAVGDLGTAVVGLLSNVGAASN
jgi:hypothetical protein